MDEIKLMLGSICEELATLADAAERIAAALEAKDDPDAYVYSEYSCDLIEEARREGWQVYRVLPSGDADYPDPVYVMRRPRQEDTDA